MRFLTTILFVLFVYLGFAQNEQKSKIDFKYLIGTWVPISTHDNNDTLLSDFLPDTTEDILVDYRYEYEHNGVLDIRVSDAYEILKYATYSVNKIIYTYSESKNNGTDINGKWYRVLYLDTRYMLLEEKRSDRRFIRFFMNIKDRNNWKYAEGG